MERQNRGRRESQEHNQRHEEEMKMGNEEGKTEKMMKNKQIMTPGQLEKNEQDTE